MDNLNSNMNNDLDYNDSNVSCTSDRSRKPQLSQTVPAQGGAASGRSDKAGGDDDTGGGSVGIVDGGHAATFQDDLEDDPYFSDEEIEDVDGQEGREDAAMALARHGRKLQRALEPLEGREHFQGPIFGEHMAPEPDTPIHYETPSPSMSLMVEYSNSSSEESSLESSGFLPYQHHNTASQIVVYMGGIGEPTFEATPGPSSLVPFPLWLSPNVHFA